MFADTGEKKKDDNMQRTLAILIAIIAIVALVVICLAKFCHRKGTHSSSYIAHL